MTTLRAGRRWRHRDERGQATVEFALVLPIVVMLALGVVQVARVTAFQVAVIDSARSAARAAAVDPTDSTARRTVAATGGGADAEVHLGVVDGAPGLVTVRVIRRIRLLPGVGASSVALHAESTMAVESSG
ncbi:MAG: pilus assembly protein [Actinobacteria bacterium]|nr:pilus assembly protein [Actinomycetota bacterium]